MSRRIIVVAPSPRILGGQGAQTDLLVESVRHEGYHVDFVPIDPAPPDYLAWTRAWSYLRTLVNQAIYLPGLRRLAETDAVHIFSALYCSFLLAAAPPIAAARTLVKWVVLNYHSGEAANHLARWRSVHYVLRWVNEIVVPSEYLQRVFARHGYRTRVIQNVVHTGRFRFRERRPIQAKLLSTRNFEGLYRVENTMRAFVDVRAAYPEATLTIVGGGSRERALRELAIALGGRGIRFLGRVERNAIPDVYDASDIFLNSSVIDNQPVSVLEALASGLPVISTAGGDIAGIIHDGETGFIVPPDDPVVMANRVCELLEAPVRASAIAAEAHRRAQLYTWPRIRDEWRQVYAGAPA